MSESPLRIATRASQLALWQANHVAELLRSSHQGLEVELIEISTQGDRDRSEPLRQFGGLGVFTSEVQNALLEQRADLAVHSLKDLPTAANESLVLASVPERASVYDALVFAADSSCGALEDLPQNARVGTGSPRRQAQLRHHRPDLDLAEIRGNVETRLRKVDDGEYDAIVLAEAGLVRLGLGDRISLRLEPPLMYPAVSQGALGLECRRDDQRTREAVSAIDHVVTHACVNAERALLRELRAGCHAPLGAFCRIDADALTLSAVVLDLEGRERVEAELSGNLETAEDLGRELAALLSEKGAAALLGEHGT